MIEKILDFGKKNRDIHCIISFGSQHFGDFKNSDDFSDLDLFLITNNPNKYLNSENPLWIQSFGKPLSILVLKNPFEGNMTCRIMLDNCISLDIIPISKNQFNRIRFYLQLKKWRINKVIKEHENIENGINTFYYYLARGYTIYCERGKITKTLKKIRAFYNPNFKHSLSKELFDQNYNDFWQTAYKQLGTVVRKDILYGLVTLDNLLKKRLIEMIEWGTKLDNPSLDTYYFAKKINSWADSSTLENLKKTQFSLENGNHYVTLIKNLKLYQEHSHKVSRSKGYKINPELERKVISKLYSFKERANA